MQVVPRCLVPYIGGCGKLAAEAMTIYRTRYRDPKAHRWVSAWSETRVTAEFRRAEIDRRFAGRKLEIEIAIERFELNPGKSDIVRFLNAHADE